MFSTSKNILHEFNVEILKAKENERHSIARELHDEMSQYLASMHYYASSIIKLSAATAIVEDAKAIDLIASRMSEIVHHKIKQLRSEEFNNLEQNFSELCLKMINDWKTKNTHISLHINIDKSFSTINTNVLFTIYRLLQECLTNIERHSKASNVALTIERIGHYISLKINDDGCGCDLDKQTERFGILGMKERVVDYNGILIVVSSIGQGFSVNALLPYNT